MSRSAYEQMIKEDIERLCKFMPDCSERKHIILVLICSITHYYGVETNESDDIPF